MGSAGVGAGEHLVGEKAAGVAEREVLGDLERHPFVFGEGLAEAVALLGVLDRLVEGLAGGADARQRDEARLKSKACMAPTNPVPSSPIW